MNWQDNELFESDNLLSCEWHGFYLYLAACLWLARLSSWGSYTPCISRTGNTPCGAQAKWKGGVLCLGISGWLLWNFKSSVELSKHGALSGQFRKCVHRSRAPEAGLPDPYKRRTLQDQGQLSLTYLLTVNLKISSHRIESLCVGSDFPCLAWQWTQADSHSPWIRTCYFKILSMAILEWLPQST